MADIRIVDQTLFGEWEAAPETPGESYLGQLVFELWENALARSEWCMDYLEFTGNILLEMEDHFLLNDCLKSYVSGLYSATIVTSDAFIERLITDFLETRGLVSEIKGSLGRKLAGLEKYNLVDANVCKRVSRLHRIRNNLAHEKGPDDEFRIFRRALSERIPSEHLIERDAREAVMLAYGIAARIKRNFPR